MVGCKTSTQSSLVVIRALLQRLTSNVVFARNLWWVEFNMIDAARGLVSQSTSDTAHQKLRGGNVRKRGRKKKMKKKNSYLVIDVKLKSSVDSLLLSCQHLVQHSRFTKRDKKGLCKIQSSNAQYSPCPTVRGKPSNKNPLAHAGLDSSALMSPTMRSSGTSFQRREKGRRKKKKKNKEAFPICTFPASMMGLALLPKSVPCFTASRKRSPVLK